MKYAAHVHHDGERFYLGTFGSREAARDAEQTERVRLLDGTSALLECAGTMALRTFAAHIGVKYGTLKRWHSEGMPSVRIANMVRVRPEDAEPWILARYPNSVAFGRSSVIYIAQRTSDEAVKIGFTSDVVRRIRELRKLGDVILLAAFPGDKRHELALHARFAKYRLDGEWFRLPFDVDLGAVVDFATVVA